MTWPGGTVAIVLGISGSLMLNRDSSRADSTTITFDSYALGNINGQDGWSKTGPFDVEVVADGGGKALRISDAVTSGSFGDQTFSKSLVDEAGETLATNGGMSGGTRQNHFEVSWDIKSFTGSAQTGLTVSFAPDRGDGGRMSYFRVEDNGSGLDVFFYDVQQPGPVRPCFARTLSKRRCRASTTRLTTRDRLARPPMTCPWLRQRKPCITAGGEDYFRRPGAADPTPTPSTRLCAPPPVRNPGAGPTPQPFRHRPPAFSTRAPT
ncbi:hypothetical protein [Candidatus Amarobacter glycogenicus]|uniref:hypothetical protein n=1 Tax=Candidatus Amarobacter glycogenicus TaxID=3140699 RepID=UPI002A15B194|nr:hypothetical protein [Dehalococcoidia bacterium]